MVKLKKKEQKVLRGFNWTIGVELFLTGRKRCGANGQVATLRT